jgi:hypothetical protein
VFFLYRKPAARFHVKCEFSSRVIPKRVYSLRASHETTGADIKRAVCEFVGKFDSIRIIFSNSRDYFHSCCCWISGLSTSIDQVRFGYNQFDFHDDKLVDQGICDGSLITARLPAVPLSHMSEMQICVKTLTGKTTTLDVFSHDSILTVKELTEVKQGLFRPCVG